MEEINSLQNSKIKFFFSLKEKKNILKENLFLVEGENLIKEALSNDIVELLLITNKDFYLDINIKKVLVTKEIIKKLSFVKTNIGAIAICKYEPKIIDMKKMKKIIVLDEIQNPNNLGAIIRTAKGFSFDAVILLNDSTFPFNDKVIRASQGAVFNLPVILLDDINLLKEFHNYFFILNRKAMNINKIRSIEEKISLVFGNEKRGISLELLKKLNGEEIFIPIGKDLESLNLAVSAGIAMYYFNNL